LLARARQPSTCRVRRRPRFESSWLSYASDQTSPRLDSTTSGSARPGHRARSKASAESPNRTGSYLTIGPRDGSFRRISVSDNLLCPVRESVLETWRCLSPCWSWWPCSWQPFARFSNAPKRRKCPSKGRGSACRKTTCDRDRTGHVPAVGLALKPARRQSLSSSRFNSSSEKPCD